MGDRGNIVIRQTPNTNTGDVWFYTHWSGSVLKETVATALAKRQRWDDSMYLTRIVFDVLTDGCHGEETGYGISTSLGDNENPIIVVDCPAQCVWEVRENQLKRRRLPDKIDGLNIGSFQSFIEGVTV